MGKELFTTKQFIDAIPGSGGIISIIAKRVGCNWHTAKKYINKPTVRQAYDDECEAVLDMCEGKLMEAIRGGDLAAIKYYLSTKGRKRGYGERIELAGDEAQPVRIVWFRDERSNQDQT